MMLVPDLLDVMQMMKTGLSLVGGIMNMGYGVNLGEMIFC